MTSKFNSPPYHQFGIPSTPIIPTTINAQPIPPQEVKPPCVRSVSLCEISKKIIPARKSANYWTTLDVE